MSISLNSLLCIFASALILLIYGVRRQRSAKIRKNLPGIWGGFYYMAKKAYPENRLDMLRRICSCKNITDRMTPLGREIIFGLFNIYIYKPDYVKSEINKLLALFIESENHDNRD